MAKVGSLKLKDTLTAGEGATINDATPSPSTVYSSSKVASLIPDALADLSEDTTHRVVTDTEKTTWNNKLSSETSHADVLVDADIGVTVQAFGSYLTSLGWGYMIYPSDDANGLSYYYPATRCFDLHLKDTTIIALPDPSNWANEFMILRAYDLGAYAPLTFGDFLDPDLIFTTNGQSVILISDGISWLRVADYGFGGSADDTAYNATSWDGNTDAPTKNAVRDKFESLNTSSVPTAWGKYY